MYQHPNDDTVAYSTSSAAGSLLFVTLGAELVLRVLADLLGEVGGDTTESARRGFRLARLVLVRLVEGGSNPRK